MPAKNHHAEPFSEETLAKLEIFEDYAKAWIPTFVMQGCETICIFDFFAGPGKDKNGIYGSPIRILEKIREQIKEINSRNIQVQVYFNEFNKQKFETLKNSCTEYLDLYEDVKRSVSIKYFNKNFDSLFNDLIPIIKSKPSLVYLDQNGVKYFSKAYIEKLEETSCTDFLYFVSSSYLWRFGEQEEFKAHSLINSQELKNLKSKPYKYIHRSLIAQIRENLPIIPI